MIENTEKTLLIKKQQMNKIQRIVKELMDMYDYRYGDEQEWNNAVQSPDEVDKLKKRQRITLLSE